jgi:hypothetical protein
MRKWGGGEKGGGDIWVRVGASQKSCGRMTQQAKRVSFAVVFNFIFSYILPAIVAFAIA